MAMAMGLAAAFSLMALVVEVLCFLLAADVNVVVDCRPSVEVFL